MSDLVDPSDVDLLEAIRHWGADDFIDAILDYGEEVYGDRERAVSKAHATFLARAERFCARESAS